jgi:hypothetical protein
VSTDVPVVGDWNNDGTDTLGFFRRGIWHLTNFFDRGFADATFGFGHPTDIPVVGDWNNDGTDTLGVVRETNPDATWFISNRFDTGYAEGNFTFGFTASEGPSNYLSWR